MGNNLKSRIAAALALAAAALFAAAPAFAANTQSFSNAVNQVTEAYSSVTLAVGYGILTLIGGVALIIGGKQAFLYITSDGTKGDKRQAIIGGVTLLAAIVLILFLPTLINAAAGVVDTDVSIGTVQKGA